ncbi:hypothetical protein GIB67_013038 [Kingdonia uniflora]|uniref:Oil body-associated protein 1A n=1 Tax=Kingdonia uniflora TaxID=39325 RepID=A0A7J7MCJ4_9MAGN|nr:hypothetical protein GIB67_013038 [Kingdonia uniflora]
MFRKKGGHGMKTFADLVKRAVVQLRAWFKAEIHKRLNFRVVKTGYDSKEERTGVTLKGAHLSDGIADSRQAVRRGCQAQPWSRLQQASSKASLPSIRSTNTSAHSTYAHDMTRQIVAHHFCACENVDMRQCLIYDIPEADARLIGLEYIISENLFLTLPDSEKLLWHSHVHEVKSGVYFMPAVSRMIEQRDLEKVCKTYGKVFHFWHVDKGDM